jgi:signal transduction histidine kinase
VRDLVPGTEEAEVRSAWQRALVGREKATFTTACVLIAALVPAWIPFDFYLEAALAPRFLALRLADIAVTLALWRFIARSSDLRSNRVATSVALGGVALIIIVMLTEIGPAHYALYTFGFSLVFWGAGVLLVWPPRYTIGTFAAIVAAYVAALALLDRHVAASDVVGSLFYLGSAAVIASAQAVLRRRLEEQAFRASFAQESVRARDEFIAMASHELLTPLSSLRLSLDVVQRPGTSDERRQQRIAGLSNQVNRLTVLVRQLLDVTQVTSGRLAFEPEDMDLVDLVRDVAARFDDEIARSQGSLEIDSPSAAPGRWDRSRLDQMVSNLLSNAIKYGRAKPIRVRVETRPGSVVLRVADEGIGIARSDQDRVFGRFERAASPRHYGGLGVGLWIVKRIVEGSGGTIRVESEPGRGSTFIVELPVQPAPTPPRTPAQPR